MDCHEFRNQHSAFLDDTLPDAELVAMQRHLLECEACARHDTAVRRGLLIFRNLPPIEPSADFATRLNARLAQAREEARLQAVAFAHRRGPGLGAFAAAALGVVTLGYAATAAMNAVSPRDDRLVLDPVVATLPEPAPPPVATPAYVASLSAGIPVWPAVLVAEQAPMHFANTEFQLVGFTS